MARPWTFAQRISAGFIVSLLVALVLASTFVVALLSARTNNKAHILGLSTDVLEVERLRRAFGDKVSSARGLALSRDPLFAQYMVNSRHRFLAAAERLSGRFEPPGEALIREAARAEQEHEEAVQALVLAEDAGVSRERLEEAFEQRVSSPRERTFATLERLAQHAEGRLSEGVERAQVVDRWVLALTLVAASLGLLMVALLAWVLTRWLRPLKREADASSQRFQLLVEGVQDYALLLLDTRGRVASWNPGAERITGYCEDEALGRSLEDFYPPEAVAAGLPARELERTRRDGRLRTEGWRVRKDGSRLLAEVILTALYDERCRLQGYAKVTRDITERRRAERAQRLLAEAGPLFHQTLDPDQTVTELARMLVPDLADASLLCLVTPSDELLTRAVAHTDPEREEALRQALERYPPPRDEPHGVWEVLRSGRSALLSDVSPDVLARSARSPEHLALLEKVGIRSYLAVPLRAGDRTRGVFVLLTDSPWRRLTATDQVFLEELAGRAGLALENARLFREAQEAVELIGVAAHDLGNPLHALQLVLHKVRRDDVVTEPDRVRDGVRMALRQTQRLGRLLLNLLDLSSLSSGKLMLDVAPVDLSDLAHEVLERFSEQAAEAGCPLSLRAELGLVGRWDRLRLDRVVTNLLSNALKFGKGRPVELEVRRDGMGRASLSVRDHGVGIAPEAQQRIFDRFEQVKSSGRSEGFGLGLYIVRQLVDAHGGTIHVASVPGDGATFTMDLPLMQPDASAEAPGPRALA